MYFVGCDTKEDLARAIAKSANSECLSPDVWFKDLTEEQKTHNINMTDYVKVVSEDPYGCIFCGAQEWKYKEDVDYIETQLGRNDYIHGIWNLACKIMKECAEDTDNSIEYGLQHDWFPSWEQLEDYISANFVKIMSDNVYMALVVGDCKYVHTSNYERYDDVKNVKKREHWKRSVMNKLPKTPEKQREFLDYFHEDIEYMRVVTWEDLEERLNTWLEVKKKQKIHFLIESIKKDMEFYDNKEISYEAKLSDPDINFGFLSRVKSLVEYAEEFNGEKE